MKRIVPKGRDLGQQGPGKFKSRTGRSSPATVYQFQPRRGTTLALFRSLSRSLSAQAQHRPAQTLRLGAARRGGVWKPYSALAPKGRAGRTCASWGRRRGEVTQA